MQPYLLCWPCTKPAQLRKLLSAQVMNSDIECDGLGVHVIWRGNSSIKGWRLCLREATHGYIEIACAIKQKGCMLQGHSSVMNVIGKGLNVHIMIFLHLIRDARKETDYVVVVLLWAKCTDKVLGPKSMEMSCNLKHIGLCAEKNSWFLNFLEGPKLQLDWEE